MSPSPELILRLYFRDVDFAVTAAKSISKCDDNDVNQIRRRFTKPDKQSFGEDCWLSPYRIRLTVMSGMDTFIVNPTLTYQNPDLYEILISYGSHLAMFIRMVDLVGYLFVYYLVKLSL